MSVKKFSTKLGVIAATAGSAVGLGTIWRFPAEVEENGGAAFLLVYVLCMFALGIPVMLAEFSLGRGGRSDAVGVFHKLVPRSGWKYAGVLAVLSSYLILAFYMVVEGWTLEYLWESMSGGLYDGVDALDRNLSGRFHAKMQEYICSDLRPLLFTYGAIVINFGVLAAGVQKGIERLSNIMMPVLFGLLMIFVITAFGFEDSLKGLEYFFTPDFSKITPEVILSALGQTFFSLSLGMGILVTYGAYYPRDVNMPRTSLTVCAMVVLVAVMMGMIIFPAVASFGLNLEEVRGTALVFVTMPEVFMQMPWPRFWSMLFFVLLLVAALTSTVSVAEVSIAFLEDRFRMSRIKAVTVILAPLVVFSGVCALSFGSLGEIRIMGMNLFDFLDNLATNVMLPIVSIATCIFMGWFAPKGFFRNEVTNRGTICNHLYPTVRFIVRYIAPLLVLLIFISGFIDFV